MMRWNYIKSTVGLFGSAVCEGQLRKGTELAPRALREGGLMSALYNLGWQVHDYGDVNRNSIDITVVPQYNKFRNSMLMGQILIIHFNSLDSGINDQINRRSFEIAKQQQFMLHIGGDHSVASGSIHGLLEHYQDELRVIWVDAHTDCNYEYGNYHGMSAGHLMGFMDEDKIKGFEWLTHRLNPKNLIYIGIRDVDDKERKIIKESGIKYYGMDQVLELGIGEVMRRVVAEFDGKPIHCSFDVDAIDPQYAHGTGTLVDGGLSYRESHYLLRKLAATKSLVGLDMVEINPLLEKSPENREEFFGDFQQIGKIQGSQTVALGIELCASALGRTLI